MIYLDPAVLDTLADDGDPLLAEFVDELLDRGESPSALWA